MAELDHEALMELQQKRNKAADAIFDKIATLSTALLGLSITFRKEIVGTSPQSIGFFKWALVCFVIAVASATLWRFAEIDVSKKLTEKILKSTSEQRFVAAEPSAWILLCSYLGLIAFFAGIVLLTYFAWHNVQ